MLIERCSRGLGDRLLADLVERGVLTRENGPGLFSTTRWRLVNADVQAALRDRLRSVLLGWTAPTSRDAALLTLIQETYLVNRLVAKGERATARARAKELSAMNPVIASIARAVNDADTNDMLGAVVTTAAVTSFT